MNLARADMKFTVIVCTYNYAHLLTDALRTLAAQTFPDFELLVVDDGSTDHTEAVVGDYSSRFRHCVYLKKYHSGLADTRNAGVRQAKGTHLAFLDADDFWSPHYLEVVQQRLASSPQADLVFSNGLRVLDNGLVRSAVFPPGTPSFDGPVDSASDLFSLCINACTIGTVFRKSLYDRIGPFDNRFSHGDDVHWLFRAVLTGAHCVLIDRKLFLYRFHGCNMTSDPVAFLETWLRIYEEQLKNSRLGPECERKAKNFARDYVLRLLGICPPSEGRALLSQTLKALDGDAILWCAFLSTYLGSTYAMRPLKWGKRLIQKLHASAKRVDLTAEPEAIFRGL